MDVYFFIQNKKKNGTNKQANKQKTTAAELLAMVNGADDSDFAVEANTFFLCYIFH